MRKCMTLGQFIMGLGSVILGSLFVGILLHEWYVSFMSETDPTIAILKIICGIGVILLALGWLVDMIEKRRAK